MQGFVADVEDVSGLVPRRTSRKHRIFIFTYVLRRWDSLKQLLCRASRGAGLNPFAVCATSYTDVHISYAVVRRGRGVCSRARPESESTEAPNHYMYVCSAAVGFLGAAEAAVVPSLLFTDGPHSVHNPLRSRLFFYSMGSFRLASLCLCRAIPHK